MDAQTLAKAPRPRWVKAGSVERELQVQRSGGRTILQIKGSAAGEPGGREQRWTCCMVMVGIVKMVIEFQPHSCLQCHDRIMPKKLGSQRKESDSVGQSWKAVQTEEVTSKLGLMGEVRFHLTDKGGREC